MLTTNIKTPTQTANSMDIIDSRQFHKEIKSQISIIIKTKKNTIKNLNSKILFKEVTTTILKIMRLQRYKIVTDLIIFFRIQIPNKSRTTLTPRTIIIIATITTIINLCFRTIITAIITTHQTIIFRWLQDLITKMTKKY